MPIFEFKCLECEEFFEILVMNDEEKCEMKCPKCQSEELERVLSSTNYSMTGDGSSGNNAAGASANTRTCSSGSCTTYDIPGPK